MKIKKRNLSYGILKFINGKKLSVGDIANYLEKTYPDVIIVNNNIIVNADELISDNWKDFASWVNTSLLNNEIQGNKISLSNGSSEQKTHYRKACNNFIKESRKGTFELYKILQKKDKYCSIGNTMVDFFDSLGSSRMYKAGDYFNADFGFGNQMKFYTYYMDFLQIVEENLEKEFKEFINKL